MHAATTIISSPTVAAALVGAGALLGAALIAAWVQLRSQSAEDQLAAIDKLTRVYADQIIDEIAKHIDEVLDARTRGIVIGEIVKKGLREILGADPRGRRWYDNNG